MKSFPVGEWKEWGGKGPPIDVKTILAFYSNGRFTLLYRREWDEKVWTDRDGYRCYNPKYWAKIILPETEQVVSCDIQHKLKEAAKLLIEYCNLIKCKDCIFYLKVEDLDGRCDLFTQTSARNHK